MKNVYDAGDDKFRAAFEEALSAGNWPKDRKGLGFFTAPAEPSEPVQIEDVLRAVRQASFPDPETDPAKALTAAYAEALAKGSGWTKTVNGYPQHFPLDEVVQPREATNEALARENEDLKRRRAELEKQQPVNARLLGVAHQVVGLIANTSIQAGYCCCGDGMDGHASPMLCGHSATDQGAYLASLLYKEAQSAIAAAEAQQAEPVNERVIDRTWARFCGPDAPYPGMIEAFETHYGQSFRDKDWRTEAACWAAAWHKAVLVANPQAEPVPVEAIGRLLTEAMDKAVENGASSVSMPDDYVAVAAWLCRVEGADNG